MRITFVPPTENEFKQLFLATPLTKGGGLEDITIFHPKGVPYRRGAGILSFISGVAKRILPFIFKAAKPAAREFGSSVIKDVMEGKQPIRQSLKKNGIKALKQTGLRLIRGSGKIVKKKKNVPKNKKKRRRRKKGKGKCPYKSDIFKTI